MTSLIDRRLWINCANISRTILLSDPSAVKNLIPFLTFPNTSSLGNPTVAVTYPTILFFKYKVQMSWTDSLGRVYIELEIAQALGQSLRDRHRAGLASIAVMASA
jgi:hypothetical protein